MRNIFRTYSLSLYSFILFAFIICFIAQPAKAINKDDEIVNFGIMKYFFSDVNINDAKVAMEGWVADLLKEYKLKSRKSMKYTIIYYDNIAEMIDNIKKKKLEVAVIASYDYLQYDLKKYVEPIIMDKPDDKSVKVLLIDKNSNFTTINDLKSKKISIEPGIEGVFTNKWLNMITQKNGINDYYSFFSSIETCKKSNMVIMQQFFGKTDASIISLSSFKTNSEINPQIKNKIKILFSSDKLVSSVVGIRKDCQTIDRKILTEIALNVSGNIAMKSMMEMFKKGLVIPFKEEALAPVKELLKYNINKTENKKNNSKIKLR
jgi:ABC-type phosphate/phosphonate transport system substrate-binding protein